MSIKQPPIGLRPKYIVASERVIEIAEAIFRYARAQKQIPSEWLDELAIVNQEAHAIQYEAEHGD